MPKEKEEVYVTHTCKHCGSAFVDIDKTNVKDTPPNWKYCPECVKAGFKNPRTRKVKYTAEQIEAFKKRMKEYREKNK